MIKGIIGFGGFGREVYWSLNEKDRKNAIFFVDDSFYEKTQKNVLPLSKFNNNDFEVVVAIGDPVIRKKIIEKLPKKTKFFTHIHSSVILMDYNIEIGEGSIVCANTILTTNIKIGKHCHLNLLTTIGHDCTIGDFFTTAPGVKISGNCNISNRVYFGTNSSVRQKINICDDVIIGMNAAVVKDIEEPGTYTGVPCKKLIKKLI
jgi:sugar O-acyltransferase (sialic acid O-acetyltransferase NeuD family)